MAKIKGVSHLLPNCEHVDLSKMQNVRRLHDADIVAQHLDPEQHTELIKQGSEKWQELRHRCVVTGSSAYNSLGFRSSKAVDDHFNEFVYGKGPKTFTPEEMQRLQHGRDNEVIAFFNFKNHK